MGVAMKYGYARVSSDTQDYAAQVEALKAAGCERIFNEKASGKSTNGRPELANLMKALLPGDIVTVVVTAGSTRNSAMLSDAGVVTSPSTRSDQACRSAVGGTGKWQRT